MARSGGCSALEGEITVDKNREFTIYLVFYRFNHTVTHQRSASKTKDPSMVRRALKTHTIEESTSWG